MTEYVPDDFSADLDALLAEIDPAEQRRASFDAATARLDRCWAGAAVIYRRWGERDSDKPHSPRPLEAYERVGYLLALSEDDRHVLIWRDFPPLVVAALDGRTEEYRRSVCPTATGYYISDHLREGRDAAVDREIYLLAHPEDAESPRALRSVRAAAAGDVDAALDRLQMPGGVAAFPATEAPTRLAEAAARVSVPKLVPRPGTPGRLTIPPGGVLGPKR